MGLIQMWPLVFLILVPGIILLYLLKQNAKKKEISSVKIWKESYENIEATRPWEKLKQNLLMYLQIGIVLLTVFAMLFPYVKTGGSKYKNVVIFIDNSGSMSGAYNEKNSKLSEAKKQALQYIEGLKKGTSITVVSSNGTANIEGANISERAQVKKVIQGIKETSSEGGLDAGVSVIQSMAAQWDSYHVEAFTDSDYDLKSLKGEVVDVSADGTNGTVEYVSHTIKENGKMDILAKISNTGKSIFSSDINLYIGKDIVEIKDVKIKEDESQMVYFQDIDVTLYENVLKNGAYIKVQINEKDALMKDNEKVDFVTETHVPEILLVTEQNVFLEKALTSGMNVNLTKANSIENVDKSIAYDLIIYDGMNPSVLPKTGNVLLINQKSEKKKKENLTMTFTNSDVTSYISDFSFGCKEGTPLSVPSYATEFIRSGAQVYGYYSEKDGRVIGEIGFDFHDTDFPLQMEFPIFIQNYLTTVLDAGVIREKKIAPGEIVELYFSADNTEVFVTNPDGKKEDIDGRSAIKSYVSTEKPGVYTVTLKENKDVRIEPFAVEFPVSESLCKAGIKGVLHGEETTKTAEKVDAGLNLTPFLICLIGLVFILEAILYFLRVPRKGKKENLVFIAKRSVLVLCLILALLDLSITTKKGYTTTLFLVDVSDSMAGCIDEVTEEVADAVQKLPKKERAGVVAFGADALVEQFVTEKTLFTALETSPITSATNLEKAIQSGMALFPDDGSKRIVLITDGRQNQGDLLKMSSTLVANQIEVILHQKENQIGEEVYISDMQVPEKIALGDSFQVEITIQSTVDTVANLSLYADDICKKKETVQLSKGENVFTFNDKRKEEGYVNYHAMIEAQDDNLSVNNEYVAYTEAQIRDKVLVIEGKTNNATELEKILKAANIDSDKISVSTSPSTIQGMNQYKSILLVDVHADDLPEGFLNNLDNYVKNYGGGLVAIGGKNSFVLGNYRDTPLENVLPVKMQIEGEKEIPKMAFTMVIDRSSSMLSMGGEIDKLELAKEAAIGALENVRDTDEIGLLTYNDAYSWVIKPEVLSDRESVINKISAIEGAGGTSIYPALSEAYEKIKDSDAKIKHIILLTDGMDGQKGYDPLLEKMRKDKVTLSTVAVGNEVDRQLLSYLALSTDGRYYNTTAEDNLPRIFANEVYLSMDNYVVEEEFTPVVQNYAGILEGVTDNGLPSMKGYLATTKKDTANVVLESLREEPVLAAWQYGLGKTVAFTTDAENKWTKNYANWDAYTTLWKNIVQYTMQDIEDDGSTLEVDTEDAGATVRYTTKDYTEDTTVEVLYVDEDGKEKRTSLEATAPGTFEGDVDLVKTGVYSMSVQKMEGKEVISNKNAAITMQYSKEYRFDQDVSVLNEFITRTNGKKLVSLDGVYDEELPVSSSKKNLTIYFLIAFILLFMYDVAARRLQFSLLEVVKKTRKKAVVTKQEKENETVKVEKQKTKPQKVKTKVKKEPVKTELLDTGALLKKKEERKG